MKKIVTMMLSMVAAAAFTVHAAESTFGFTALDEMFEKGNFEGAAGLIYRYEDHDGAAMFTGDSGAAFIEFEYESNDWNGLMVGFGGLAIEEIYEDDDVAQGNSWWDTADSAILKELYINYQIAETETDITVGRKQFKKVATTDGDSHQGIQVRSKDIANTTLYVQAIERWIDNASASWDGDGIDNNWADVEDMNAGDADDFVYSLIAEINAVPDMLTVTPYMYYHEDVMSTYGISGEFKTQLTEEVMGSIDGAYASHDDDTGADDVDQYYVHGGVDFRGWNFGLGYYEFGDDGDVPPAGGVQADDMSPMEEDAIYAAGAAMGAETIWGDVSYQWDAYSVTVLYGEADSDMGDGEELDIYFNWDITDTVTAELFYGMVDDEVSGNDDYDVLAGSVAISF